MRELRGLVHIVNFVPGCNMFICLSQPVHKILNVNTSLCCCIPCEFEYTRSEVGGTIPMWMNLKRKKTLFALKIRAILFEWGHPQIPSAVFVDFLTSRLSVRVLFCRTFAPSERQLKKKSKNDKFYILQRRL